MKKDLIVEDPSRWLFRWPFCYLPARWVLTPRAMVLLNSISATIARLQIDAMPNFTIIGPGAVSLFVSLLEFARGLKRDRGRDDLS